MWFKKNQQAAAAAAALTEKRNIHRNTPFEIWFVSVRLFTLLALVAHSRTRCALCPAVYFGIWSVVCVCVDCVGTINNSEKAVHIVVTFN